MGEKFISNPTEVSGGKPDEPLASPIEAVVDEASGATTEQGKSWRFWAAFLFLFLCAFASAVDATVLGTALPYIAEDLNGTSILTFWCATAFFLSKTVVQPGTLSIS